MAFLGLWWATVSFPVPDELIAFVPLKEAFQPGNLLTLVDRLSLAEEARLAMGFFGQSEQILGGRHVRGRDNLDSETVEDIRVTPAVMVYFAVAPVRLDEVNRNVRHSAKGAVRVDNRVGRCAAAIAANLLKVILTPPSSLLRSV